VETNKIISRSLIEIREDAVLVITDQFLNQVKYICSKISEVEWSGLLFFKTEGEPKDLENFKVVPYYIHVMDKGSTGYTEFDDDGSAKALYEAMPELDPFEGNGYRYGKIHSHNSMGVFHSATDMQDLQDQAGAYSQYYLSVIVNNFMDIEAKMAFVAEIPVQKINPIGFKGASWQLPKKEVLVTIDFEIENTSVNISIPEALKTRIEEVIEEAKPAAWRGNGRGFHMGHNIHGTGMLGMYEDEEDDEYNGYGKQDISNYRGTQGKIVIRDFLHDFFEDKVPMTDVFDALDASPPIIADKIIKKFILKFNALGDWSRQNIIMFIEDAELPEKDSNQTSLYESIWNTVKLVD